MLKRFIYLTSSSRDIKQSVCFIQQCSLLPACGERVGCMMVKLLILSNVFFSTQNRDPLPLGRQWREQATHLLVLLSAPSRSPCLGVGWRWPYMQRAVHITIGAVFFLLFFFYCSVRAGYRSSACGRFKRAVCSFGCGAAAAANGLHFADDDIITLPLARQIWRSHCVQFFFFFVFFNIYFCLFAHFFHKAHKRQMFADVYFVRVYIQRQKQKNGNFVRSGLLKVFCVSKGWRLHFGRINDAHTSVVFGLFCSLLSVFSLSLLFWPFCFYFLSPFCWELLLFL